MVSVMAALWTTGRGWATMPLQPGHDAQPVASYPHLTRHFAHDDRLAGRPPAHPAHRAAADRRTRGITGPRRGPRHGAGAPGPVGPAWGGHDDGTACRPRRARLPGDGLLHPGDPAGAGARPGGHPPLG